MRNIPWEPILRIIVILVAIGGGVVVGSTIYSFVNEWSSTQDTLEEIRQEFHWFRVMEEREDKETAQWAIREFDSLMDTYEQEAVETSRYYYFGNLSDDVLPLLRYLARATWDKHVSEKEVAERASRMARYLHGQPTRDNYSQEELARVWAIIGAH